MSLFAHVDTLVSTPRLGHVGGNRNLFYSLLLFLLCENICVGFQCVRRMHEASIETFTCAVLAPLQGTKQFWKPT